MEYVYAVLLLHAAKRDINEDNLRKVLEAAGIAVDEVRLKALVAAVKEINIDDVIRGATAAPITPAVSTAPTVSQPSAQPEKVEEKKEEEKKETVSEEQLAE
ncbi:MAG TPA: 50S ribosomal protein P1, partial [Ignisphaera sp.]|nr:50S ribosomal protein P1 [Ignisphaera sp.]